MPVDLIQYAFVAGELSPKLFGRTDLEKYDLGLAEARNFFIDYRGGLSTRPGTQFIDFIWRDNFEVKMFPFRFAPGVEDTYVLLFGSGYIRFVQAGGLVLEATKTITAVSNTNPCRITAVGHGFSTADWVSIFAVNGVPELNERTFEIVVINANNFDLYQPYDAAVPVDATAYGTYVSGGGAARLYTVTSPYSAADLPKLKAHQIRDVVRLTHPDYAGRTLTRSGHTNWTFSTETFGTKAPRANKPTINPSGAAGSAGAIFAVTAVDLNGEEGRVSEYGFMTNAKNYTQEEGHAKVTWAASPNVQYYNVYRSRIVNQDSAVTRAMELGFIGQAFGPEFVDNNIIPDFTATPPQHFNPFADGRIEHIEVVTTGSGYNKDAGIAVAGGVGFEGFPVVNNAGQIISVVVLNGGEGFPSGPTITITGGGAGTGFTATATIGLTGGNFPSVSTIYQQRQVYASTINQPLTVWGSRPGRFSNFDFSRIVLDNDSYEFDIDSSEVASIEHLIPTRQGLLLLSTSGVWLLHGGEEVAITPTNAGVELQSSQGSSSVRPIEVESDLLYVEGRGLTVRLLEYSELSKAFSGKDMSILSNHLFSPSMKIIKWAYAGDPHKIVWAVRSDGVLLAFTLVKEQNVFAWTPCTTRGRVLDVEVVREGNIDVTYIIVERRLFGGQRKLIERIAPRNFTNIEDAWCVDCGRELNRLYQNADVRPTAATGTSVPFRSTTSSFTSADVGKIIHGNGGKATIVAFVDPTTVLADIHREFAHSVEDPAKSPYFLLAMTWTMRTPIAEVPRLWHLEGETVSVLADGNVETQKVVSGGKVTLDSPAVLVTVGFPFTAQARTLPPTVSNIVVESRRKDVISLAVRIQDTRGLKVGATLDKLYEMKERTTEPYGQPIMLQQGNKVVLIAGDWDTDGQTYLVQDQPLPATILGIVKEVDVGDDKD